MCGIQRVGERGQKKQVSHGLSLSRPMTRRSQSHGTARLTPRRPEQDDTTVMSGPVSCVIRIEFPRPIIYYHL